jgi:microcystin-dependent protein
MGMNMVQLDNGNFIVQSHVGQVIMSTTLDTEDKVKQYYGGTSWTKIEGRFLIGASSSYGVGTTGGEATHVLTVAEMPSHSHGFARQQWYAADTVVSSGTNSIYSWKSSTGGTTSASYKGGVYYTGGGSAHNNIPPYYAVYIWVRTA